MMIGLVALASCTSSPETTSLPVSLSNQKDSSLADRIYQQVNTYRKCCGARELQRHRGLDKLAQQHCEYLRSHRGTFSLQGKNVSHYGFEGRALVARERYHMENVSENVAAANRSGGDPASSVIALWKGSKSHHKSMLDDWSLTGVGVVVDTDGTVFSTQLFSTPPHNFQMSTRERFNQF